MCIKYSVISTTHFRFTKDYTLHIMISVIRLLKAHLYNVTLNKFNSWIKNGISDEVYSMNNTWLWIIHVHFNNSPSILNSRHHHLPFWFIINYKRGLTQSPNHHKSAQVFMYCTRYSFQILMKLEPSGQIFEISSNIKSWKSVQWEPSCSMGPDKRTDIKDVANSCFSQFCESA
jgi:hypothetical protein